ncbi:MAG: hypothetical protein QM758_15235 [Armatimonas sp.]
MPGWNAIDGKDRAVAEESLTGKDTDARHTWINQVVGGRYEVLESVGETPWLWIFRVRDQLQNRILTLRLLRGDLSNRDAVEQRQQQVGSGRYCFSRKALCVPTIW